MVPPVHASPLRRAPGVLRAAAAAAEAPGRLEQLRTGQVVGARLLPAAQGVVAVAAAVEDVGVGGLAAGGCQPAMTGRNQGGATLLQALLTLGFCEMTGRLNGHGVLRLLWLVWLANDCCHDCNDFNDAQQAASTPSQAHARSR